MLQQKELRAELSSRAQLQPPASQPMPAFWLRPNRFPEGAVSSISADSGSIPAGPAAWVATPLKAASCGSRIDVSEIGSMAELLPITCQYRSPQLTGIQ